MMPPVSHDADDVLTVTTTVLPASAVLTVAGEIDSYSAPRLVGALAAVLPERPTELTVDLNAVSFLDSAGVQALAEAYRRTASTGTRLRVLATHRAVIRPLQLTGLWTLLSRGAASSESSSAA